MGSKNYYSILGIPENASEEDIKTAYRKLVLRFHPDKNQGKESEEWEDIQKAYEFLNNSSLRASYRNVKAPARIRRGTNLDVSLKINASDIANESIKNIVTYRQSHCPDCKGTGCSSHILTPCPKCNGSGIDVISVVMGVKKYCSLCKGYGDFQEEPNCKKCKGTGLIETAINRKIKISRNFQPSIVIPQSGNYAMGGSIPGDLNVILVVEKTNTFEISGKDIKGHLKISPAQAVLGDIIFMDVFGDPVKVTIPPGTKHGETIEKENTGVSKGGKRGSLLLKITIDVPKKISEEEKSLYTQLLKIQKGFL